MPYILNIFPQSKATLNQLAIEDSIVGPLVPVIVDKVHEEKLSEEDLADEAQVTFKYLKHQFLKCYQLAPDDRFKHYLTALEATFDKNSVQAFIHMILTCVSMPQYVNTYKFLINMDKHQL